MKKTLFLSLIIFTFSVFGYAQNKADFSGTWVFGQMISRPNEKLKTALYKMNITQTSTDIKIVTSLNKAANASGQNSTETYTFNQETPINIQNANGKITGKLKASLKNNKLNLVLSQNIQLANKEVSLSVNDIYELSDDQKTLKVKRDIRMTDGVPTFEMFIAQKVDSSAAAVADNIYDISDLPSVSKKNAAGNLNVIAKNLPKPAFISAFGSSGVAAIIDEDGKIIFARAVTGGILLGSASVEAAMKSTFEPVKVDGKSVKVSGILNYTFIR